MGAAVQGKAYHWGKSGRIAEQLRAHIVTGEWPAGSRLPSRAALERTFQTTPATIQRAIDSLRADGFVVVEGRRGTFVHEKPPHLHRVGVVFPCDPAQPESWHRLYAAIDQEARRLQHEGTHDLRLYHGTADPEAAGRAQLLADVAANRLAGALLVSMSPSHFADTALLDHPRLRVAALSSERRAGVLPVSLASFLGPAVQAAVAAQRRRLALIHNPAAQAGEAFAEALAAAGLPFHPNWCVPVWPANPEGARAAAFLLLRQPARERPDAILVNDDYLAEETTRGILEAGAKVPADVRVYVQCNFPNLPPALTPTERLGYDLRAGLRQCLAALLAPEPPHAVQVPVIDEAQWRAAQPQTVDAATTTGAT